MAAAKPERPAFNVISNLGPALMQSLSTLSFISSSREDFTPPIVRLQLLFIGLIACTAAGFSQDCEIDCDANDPIEIVGSQHTITFAGVQYDYENCTTCFYYCITNGESPAISHTIFGASDCQGTCLDEEATVGLWSLNGCEITQSTGGSPTQGTDPTTGICGVKFDEGIAGERRYFICVDGIQPVGTIKFGIKAGQNEFVLDIPGPEDCSECTPTVTCPGDITIECDESIDPDNTGYPSITNDCDAEISYEDEMSDGCPRVITRNWKVATLCQGDPITCIQTITISDEPLSITCTLDDIDLGCNPENLPTIDDALTRVSSENKCITWEVDAGPITGGCEKSQTFTVTVMNDCGTSASCDVTYRWQVDNTAPEISISSSNDPGGACNPTIEAPTFVVTDNCIAGEVSVEANTDGPIPDGCGYTQTWTATYTDECGNHAEAVSVTYKWTEDNRAPEIVIASSNDPAGACNPTIEAPTFVATDNCIAGEVSVEANTDGPIPDGCGYTQTWTATYTDECGNHAEAASVTYTWTEDNRAPEIVIASSNDPAGACNPTIEPPTFTATDNCLGDAVNVVANTDGSTNVGCAHTQTWTATYVDGCGNAAEAVSVTYTWTVDTTAPEIVILSSNDPAGACNPTIEPPTFTATDSCLGDTVNVVANTDGFTNVGCAYRQTWTTTYVDGCGNAAEAVSVTYTWTVDTTAPEIVILSSNDPAGACNPTIEPPTFTARDNCLGDAVNVVANTDGSTNVGCAHTQTWTATYVDGCGNAAEAVSVTYTWTVDTTAPQIVIASSNDPAGACNPTIEPPTFTATDNCLGDAVNVVANTDGSTNVGCAHTQTWTATYVDGCGNAAEAVSVTYTWTVDTTAPEIVILSSNDPAGACNPTIEPPTFTATDNCLGDAVNVVANTDGFTNVGCAYRQTWTATYVDGCGNAAEAVSVTYTWTVDTTAPEIVIASSNDPAGACNPTIEPPTFVATDNCLGDAVNVVANTDGSTNVGCAYTQTWTATYVDGCGNAAEAVSVTYTWTVDTTAPEIVIASSNDPAGACNSTIEPPTFTATDNCLGDAVNVVANTDGSTNVGCAYRQTWTATYVDGCGNAAEAVSVTYSWTVDTTAPEIVIASSNDPAGACNPTIEPPTFAATDNCLGDTVNVMANTDGSTHVGCAHTQTWTATYVDGCGNAAEAVSVTYTWTVDTTAPEIVIASSNDPAGACNSTIEPPTFTATDNCLGDAVNVVANTDGFTNVGCAYRQTWTATYVDGCGNAAEAVSVTYTWTVDTTAPEIVIASSNDPAGACNPTIEPPTFTATDNCLGDAVNVMANTDGSTNVGCAHTQTWTATYVDGCGNAAEAVSVTYTWTVDTTAPEIVIASSNDPAGACNPTIEPPTFTATDNCLGDAVNVVANTDGFTNVGCAYRQTWTATYVDGCGNAAEAVSVTYTWTVDTTAPEIVIASSNDPAGACNSTIEPPTFTATDNCLGDAVNVVANTDGFTNVGCAYRQTWTATYVDGCGNAAEAVSVTYTWTVDTTAPEIVIASSNDPAGACNPTIEPPTFTATDNCLGDAVNVVANTDGSTNVGCAYRQTWTATYVDGCGNAAEAVSVTYTWTVDTTAPEIVIASSNDPAGACNPTIEPPTFTATDNCLGDAVNVVANTDGFTNVGCAYRQTWTATYVDGCGNAAEAVSVTYTWTVDTTAPEIVILSSNDPAGACNPTIEPPTFTATDNCLGDAVNVVANTDGFTNVGCAYRQTWTATYVDGCGNAAEAVSVTYTWTVDTTAPEIVILSSNDPAGACNPTIEPPTFTATDNCLGDAVNVVANTDGFTNVGCAYRQTWTATYVDGCANAAEAVSVTYTWTVDTTAPEIMILSSNDPAGACNPTIEPPTFTATDNCIAGEVSVEANTDGPIPDGCGYRQTWTATYVDGCGNAAEAVSVTYTWTVDTTAPEIVILSSNDPAGACNPTIEPPTFTATDNCLAAEVSVEANTDGPIPDGCGYRQTWTATYVDGCGNAAEAVSVTYTWTVDTTAPEVSCPEEENITGCSILEMGDFSYSEVPVQVDDPAAAGVEVSDNCGEVNLSYVDSTDGICPIVVTRTWTATDACGNSSSCRQTLRITPNLTCEIRQVECEGVDATLSVIVTSDCKGPFAYIWYKDGELLEEDGATIMVGEGGTYSVTVSYGDCSTSCSTTVAEECGTSFALLQEENDAASHCFQDPIEQNGEMVSFSRWGWTLGPLVEGTYTVDLWEGAAHCDTRRGQKTGTASITYDATQGTVVVDYLLMDGEHYLESIHLYAGCDPYPTKRKGKTYVPTVAPGQYPYKDEFSENVTLWDNADDPLKLSDCEGAPIYVILHASTCDLICDHEEREDSKAASVDKIKTVRSINRGRFSLNRQPDERLSVQVSPNPVSNFLILEVEHARAKQTLVQLYDIMGRLVYEKKIAANGSKIILEIPDFVADGLHHLMVRDQDQFRSIPIIVNHR